MERRKYNEFVQLFAKRFNIEKNKKIVILCVGSNRVIGDSFGPIVGSKLSEKLKNNDNIVILGNMIKPICRKNLKNVINKINEIENKYVILIDAAVSEKEYIGNIFVNSNRVCFGKSLGFGLYALGDISIKAGVCNNYNDSKRNFYELQNVPKKFINELSEIVSQGIYEVLAQQKYLLYES